MAAHYVYVQRACVRASKEFLKWISVWNIRKDHWALVMLYRNNKNHKKKKLPSTTFGWQSSSIYTAKFETTKKEQKHRTNLLMFVYSFSFTRHSHMRNIYKYNMCDNFDALHSYCVSILSAILQRAIVVSPCIWVYYWNFAIRKIKPLSPHSSSVMGACS